MAMDDGSGTSTGLPVLPGIRIVGPAVGTT
jgi:hypothetical protein